MLSSRRLLALLPFIVSSGLTAGCGDGGSGGGPPTVISASGRDVAAAVDEFRDLLGSPNNGGAPGRFDTGRREINWDGVEDDFASPNFLPNDYFNDTEAPRARGIRFSTPGDGVQVSADADNQFGAARRFGNINPEYSDSFVTFSEERLFSPIGSNIVELRFTVPGQPNLGATISGFGAVYTGVDRAETSSFEFFDRQSFSLGKFEVPVSENGLSFLGVKFPKSAIAIVRIEYGNSALGPDESATVDVAVMDDFLYSEPDQQGDPG
jgi:hypothetical protein